MFVMKRLEREKSTERDGTSAYTLTPPHFKGEEPQKELEF